MCKRSEIVCVRVCVCVLPKGEYVGVSAVLVDRVGGESVAGRAGVGGELRERGGMEGSDDFWWQVH